MHRHEITTHVTSIKNKEKEMRCIITKIVTHGFMLAIGFVMGIYLLPILTAPKSPDAETIQEMAQDARYSAELTRDLRGSDFLHWGEGTISLTSKQIIHEGRLAPGPDYKLYLTKEFVEHEDEFLPIKENAKYIGDIKSFGGFIIDIPKGININEYSNIIIWCEAFSEFITAAKYK